MRYQEVFEALSDPARRKILLLLRGGELSAGAIGAHFDTTPAAISYHLGLLKRAELVEAERRKNYIFYRLNRPAFGELAAWAAQFQKAGGRGGRAEREDVRVQ